MNVKNGLELCQDHKQECNQSHFDKHNCDYCKLQKEVERLRAELAIYTSPKKMTIKKLPWMCGNCGKQTVDCIRSYTGSDGESLLGTCSNCGSEWVS